MSPVNQERNQLSQMSQVEKTLNSEVMGTSHRGHLGQLDVCPFDS